MFLDDRVGDKSEYLSVNRVNRVGLSSSDRLISFNDFDRLGLALLSVFLHFGYVLSGTKLYTFVCFLHFVLLPDRAGDALLRDLTGDTLLRDLTGDALLSFLGIFFPTAPSLETHLLVFGFTI